MVLNYMKLKPSVHYYLTTVSSRYMYCLHLHYSVLFIYITVIHPNKVFLKTVKKWNKLLATIQSHQFLYRWPFLED